MRTLSLLALLGLAGAVVPAASAAAQEHPARRAASIVSVAVEEYAKAVDSAGRLVSAQEFSETRDFLVDARGATDRLSGPMAVTARQLLDSLSAAVEARRPPAALDSLQRRFAAALGNEGRLELPAHQLDLAAGRRVFERTCASCHGMTGLGDGPAGRALTPRPPAIGDARAMHDVTPALMYRVTSVGIAGTPMIGYANALTSEQRWNVVAYLGSLRHSRPQELEGEGLFIKNCSSCHGVNGTGDGALARALTRLPPEIGNPAWQLERSDAQIAGVVRHGIPGSAMPPSPELTDAQVASIVAYVRGLPFRERSVMSGGGRDSLTPALAARNVLAQLEQSLTAARTGRVGDAVDKAFDAYIAFEPIEAPARAKNPGLVAAMEGRFAEFKAAVRASDLKAAERTRDAIEASLDDVVALTAPSGSATEAFWQSFLIILREGFEAILVIGAVVAFLIKTGHRDRLRSIWTGVVLAIVASGITAVIMRTILVAMPASRPLVEGVSLLLAVAVLFSVSYWLISKVEAAKWQQFIREKVNAALEQGGGRALAFVAFLAVYREGAETALFYQALFNEGPQVALPLSLGIGAGFIALAVIFTLFYRFGVRIPLRPFFSITSALLYYMAFVFMGKGIAELQEGNFIPVTAITSLPRIDWLGFYPTWQGIIAQLVMILLFAFALLKSFWPRRSVSLPTMMHAPVGPPPSPAEMDELRLANDELRQRVLALEDAARVDVVQH